MMGFGVIISQLSYVPRVSFALHADVFQDGHQEGFLHPHAQGRHPKLLQLLPQGTHGPTQPIGRGGYGVVYQARLKQPPYSDRVVKVINKRFVKNPELLKNEISILKKLDHPHIVKLYESFEDESFLYLVEEYACGYAASAKGASCSTAWTRRAAFRRRKRVRFSWRC